MRLSYQNESYLSCPHPHSSYNWWCYEGRGEQEGGSRKKAFGWNTHFDRTLHTATFHSNCIYQLLIQPSLNYLCKLRMAHLFVLTVIVTICRPARFLEKKTIVPVPHFSMFRLQRLGNLGKNNLRYRLLQIMYMCKGQNKVSQVDSFARKKTVNFFTLWYIVQKSFFLKSGRPIVTERPLIWLKKKFLSFWIWLSLNLLFQVPASLPSFRGSETPVRHPIHSGMLWLQWLQQCIRGCSWSFM